MVVVLLALPAGAAFAQVSNFKELVSQIVTLLDTATIVLLALAVAFFFYGIVRNMMGMANKTPEKQKEFSDAMVWGIIIIFVMVSLWGIIAILQRTLLNGL